MANHWQRVIYIYPVYPCGPSLALADATITISWEYQHTTVLSYIDLVAANTIHGIVTLPHRQNRQVPMKQPDAASLRYSNPNLGSGLCTVTLGGGVALAGGHPALLTKLLTILRLIAMNSGMLLSIKSEC
jgi:hypothetical protein